MTCVSQPTICPCFTAHLRIIARCHEDRDAQRLGRRRRCCPASAVPRRAVRTARQQQAARRGVLHVEGELLLRVGRVQGSGSGAGVRHRNEQDDKLEGREPECGRKGGSKWDKCMVQSAATGRYRMWNWKGGRESRRGRTGGDGNLDNRIVINLLQNDEFEGPGG